MLKTIFSLPADVYKNRRLVMKLAKNDFKTRVYLQCIVVELASRGEKL